MALNKEMTRWTCEKPKLKRHDSKMCANSNCFESRFVWLFEKITQIKACRNAFQRQKETNKNWWFFFNRVPNIFEVMLESRAKTLKLRQHQLLLGIRITLQESCVDV